uniref:Uncharacterized protein n=1 Tax=Tanacetum cinerariifolium TaxID=118510 RepID=A0A699GGL3_TANCI|nr:hypothetical protein [Tanacetum cinerariifolium]
MVDHANYSAQQAMRSCLKCGSRQLLSSAGSAIASEMWIYRHHLRDREHFQTTSTGDHPTAVDKKNWNKHLFNSVPISTSGLKSALELSFPLPRSLQRVKGKKCVKKDFAQQLRERMKDRRVDLMKINSALDEMG